MAAKKPPTRKRFEPLDLAQRARLIKSLLECAEKDFHEQNFIGCAGAFLLIYGLTKQSTAGANHAN